MIPQPFEKIRLTESNEYIKVYATGKEYVFLKNGSFFFHSIKLNGKDVLADKIRIRLTENGATVDWSDKKTFIYSADDEKVVLISSALGKTFCVNTAITIEYDGCCFIDVKLMPIGKTVEQIFNLNAFNKRTYEIQDFCIEIPLKPEYATLYHYYADRKCDIYNFQGVAKSPRDFNAGEFKESLKLPFLPIVWLGNDELGINIFTESDEHRKYAENDAFELLKNQTEHILKINLLNARPDFWRENDPNALEKYSPITFSFGLIGTPVKPYPKKPYTRKILHIDCFKKVAGDYLDFLSNPVVEGDDEIGFDRIKRLGVTTLFLHEKWNVLQSFWEMPRETELQTKKIVEECHKRGIRVVPYFGYEMSSLNPLWSEYSEEVLDVGTTDLRKKGGWYRMPHQRDYIVCYNSKWGDMFYEGVTKLIEKMDFDGIYLDGTIAPRPCCNQSHGCGYRDEKGELHVTYPFKGAREMIKKIYTFVESRGGIVNTHLSSCMNAAALGFSHLVWNGEDIQFTIQAKGMNSVPLDYFIAEYTGRNIGTPNELLCYEFDGVWSYKDSLCLALPHGVLPRPNDIGTPLEISSQLWKIFDNFDVSTATWHPYYKDGMQAFSNLPAKTFASYYEQPDGEKLVFIANLDTEEKTAKISSSLFNGATVYEAYDGVNITQNNGEIQLTLKKYDCKILLVQ